MRSFGSFLLLLLFISAFSNAQTSYNVFDAQGSIGIADDTGKEIIPPKYENAGWSKGKPIFYYEVIGYKLDGKWGLINSSNKPITPPLYHNLYTENNLIIASKKGNFSGQEFFGVITDNGKLSIPFTYAGLEIIENAIIAQKHNYNQRQFGLIGFDNTVILPFVYSKIYSITNNLVVIEKGDKLLSIANISGKQVISYSIDSVSHASGNYLNTWKNGKVGLVDSGGITYLEPEYKNITLTSNSAEALRFNSWSFFSDEDTILRTLHYDEIQRVGNGQLITTTNDQFQITDFDSDQSSESFESIDQVAPNHFIVSGKNKYGLFANNDLIVPIDYDSLSYQNGFIYGFKSGNEMWSLLDTLGVEKSNYSYQGLRTGSEGRFPVKRNDKWGFIDRTGKELIHCVFDSVTGFHEQKAKVVFHGEQGVINLNGDWLIFPGKKEIQILNDTLYLEITADQTKLKTFENELVYFTSNPIDVYPNYLLEEIDSATNWRISYHGTIFDRESKNEPEPIPLRDSLFIVSKNDLVGIVNSSGTIIIPFVNEEIKPGDGEYLAIKRDGYYGFVDINNKLRISNRYEDVMPFVNGLAGIKIRNKWGFINKSEVLVVQPIYQEIGVFNNGICPVMLNNKWGMINLQGDLVIEPDLNELEVTKNGSWITKKGVSFGLINSSGKTILLPKYQSIIPIDSDRYIVQRKGKYGVADNNGVMTIGFNYDYLTFLEDKQIFLAMSKGEWTSVPLFPN